MEDGLILVYKRKENTSRRVVENISKKYNTKAGHIGTLDPMAKGLLPILVGNSCKLSKYLMEHNKTYLVEMKFGYHTETLDIEGDILEEDIQFRENNIVDNEFFDKVIAAMKKEMGTKKQIPPIYSAKKLNGNKLYEIARKDKEKAIEALDLHNKIYTYEKKVRKNHIKRVSNQECEIHSGLYYIDLISHFTRVCDHARNIVENVLENRM